MQAYAHGLFTNTVFIHRHNRTAKKVALAYNIHPSYAYKHAFDDNLYCSQTCPDDVQLYLQSIFIVKM